MSAISCLRDIDRLGDSYQLNFVSEIANSEAQDWSGVTYLGRPQISS